MSGSNVGIQLYTFHEWDISLPELIRRVAAVGYGGVEFAQRVRDADATAVRAALVETGTTPIAAHVSLAELESSLPDLCEHFETIGCHKLVIPHLNSDHFRTTARIDTLIDRLHEVGTRLQEAGFELIYHNGREPLLPTLDQCHVPGTQFVERLPSSVGNHLAWGLGRAFRLNDADLATHSGFGYLVAETDPDLLRFEVDAKWVAAAGYSPKAAFDLVGDRLFAVHLGNIRQVRRFPPAFEATAPGSGMLDLGATIEEARAADPEWLIIEDESQRDPEHVLTHDASWVQERIATPQTVS